MFLSTLDLWTREALAQKFPVLSLARDYNQLGSGLNQISLFTKRKYTIGHNE